MTSAMCVNRGTAADRAAAAPTTTSCGVSQPANKQATCMPNLKFHGIITIRLPRKKACFLSSGWPKLWPVGQTQFEKKKKKSPFCFFLGRKILSILQN